MDEKAITFLVKHVCKIKKKEIANNREVVSLHVLESNYM
jgi:hypothetical protein